MKRNTAALVLVACFAIIVIGVATSSLASTPVHSGFGIDVGSGSGSLNNTTATNNSSGTISKGSGPPGGSGIGIFASGGTESSVSGSTSPVVILGGLLLLAGGGILLVLWATTDSAEENSNSDEKIPQEMGSSSGSSSAPGLIDPENVIYQAWWEMVQKADVSQASTKSPDEVSSIAIESGLDPKTVTELTRLFQIVRYSESPVTTDTEHQARDLLDQVRSQSQGGNR